MCIPLVNAVLSPHSDGDATLVNAVFESSQWCACPLVNAGLSPHSDGDATFNGLESSQCCYFVNAVFEYTVVCMLPHSDGDATLVNAVFEYSQWCICPLVNAVLSPHSDGDATLVNAVFSPHSGVHAP